MAAMAVIVICIAVGIEKVRLEKIKQKGKGPSREKVVHGGGEDEGEGDVKEDRIDGGGDDGGREEQKEKEEGGGGTTIRENLRVEKNIL